MENKRLTAIEIINETVAFYSADTNRRSKSEIGRCLYAGLNGNKCAYSRCWKEGVYDPIFEGKGVIHTEMPSPDELVDEKYKGHSVDFWSDLQYLHDFNDNWNVNSLSEEGKLSVKRLLEKYKKINHGK